MKNNFISKKGFPYFILEQGEIFINERDKKNFNPLGATFIGLISNYNHDNHRMLDGVYYDIAETTLDTYLKSTYAFLKFITFYIYMAFTISTTFIFLSFLEEKLVNFLVFIGVTALLYNANRYLFKEKAQSKLEKIEVYLNSNILSYMLIASTGLFIKGTETLKIITMFSNAMFLPFLLILPTLFLAYVIGIPTKMRLARKYEYKSYWDAVVYLFMAFPLILFFIYAPNYINKSIYNAIVESKFLIYLFIFINIAKASIRNKYKIENKWKVFS